MKLFKKKPSLLDKANEEIERQRIEIKKLQNELNKKYQSFDFLKAYFDQVWNRDTPFLDEIDCENIILGYYNFDELQSLVGSKEFSDSHKENLIVAFKDYYNSILELNIKEFLYLIADLKSYKEGSSESRDKTPKDFFQWRFDFITKK